MKTLNNRVLSLLIVLVMTVISGCDKEDAFEFGEMQTDFGTEVSYKATSDGLLTVQFNSNNVSNDVFVRVYSDSNENPTTVIGEMKFSGTMTLPINKNNYWKIGMGSAGTIKIGFTPILN